MEDVMRPQPFTRESKAAVAIASFGAVAIQLRRSHTIKIVDVVSCTINMVKFLLLYSLIFCRGSLGVIVFTLNISPIAEAWLR